MENNSPSLLHIFLGISIIFSFCAKETSAQTNVVPDSIELRILKNIYDSLGGSGWNNKSNWPSPGNWPATATSAQFGTWAGIITSNGDIRTLNLGYNNLTGQLPKSLNKLSRLSSIYLMNNNISGTIPTSIGELSSLVDLCLDGNDLTGVIPSSLGNLTNLSKLRLNGNQLTGSIPASICNLSELTDLRLAGNNLTGSIPVDIGNLDKLIILFLEFNQLSGSIPASIVNLSDLSQLVICSNNLTGTIPVSIGNLTKLTNLNISSNQITGTLPASIGDLADLEIFNAGSNQLTGNIPATFSGLTNLWYFSVRQNQLTGEFPSITSWTQIAQVYLYDNQFSGDFPPGVENCLALTALDGHKNKFVSLPETILGLPVLASLNFENNDIDSIPDFSAHVNKANLSLYLRDNQLDFSQIETFVNKGLHLTTYSQQKLFDEVTYIKASTAGELIITPRDAGVNGSYTWYFQADGTYGYAIVNSLNQDATQKTFRRDSVAGNHAGLYRYRMTNSTLSGIIESVPITVRIGSDVIWNEMEGVEEINGIITKTAAVGWNNAKAISENALLANTNGWFEFIVDQMATTSSNYAFGFSQTTDNNRSSLVYGLRISSQGGQKYFIQESNENGVETGTWVPGDIFKIDRTGNTIRYYKNGYLIKSISTNANNEYKIKILQYDGSVPLSASSFWLHPSRGAVPDAWEYAALRDLYDSLGGNGWTTKTNWPASYNGVTNITAPQMDTWYGITAQNGDLVTVSFYANNMIGRIPSSIGSLKSLTTLRISENRVQGNIPSSIGNLTNLTRLNLRINELTGTIPESLGNLKKLTWLGLNNNQLEGTLPDSLFTLTSLQEMYIYLTNVSGTIPESIGNLTNLKYLYLYRNQLSGDLPASMGNLTKLQGLAFHVNNLTGNFDWIGNMHDLVLFYFYGNPNLACTIPESIGNLTKMTFLAGGGWLDVGEYVHTRVTGQIPASLGNCIKLEYIYLDNSEFYGEIPTTLNNLVNLKGLYLFNNDSLGGNLNSSISGLTNLTDVSVSKTKIEGPFPSSVATPNLSSLDLSWSHIRGEIPNNWTNAVNLEVLCLDSLEISSLPDWSASFPKLRTLRIGNNLLESLPNFSNHLNKENLSIFVANNNLGFEDLEPNFISPGTHPFDSLVYAPQQAPLEQQPPAGTQVGGELKIDAPAGGTHTVYTWEKLEGGAWINVDSWNQSSLPNQFIINPATNDDLGSYRYTITSTWVPGLFERQEIDVVITNAFKDALDQWAFQYKYDARRRMTHKKVPGADWVYMVYDNRDRLVMTQDGNQRNKPEGTPNEWTFTKYDALNRPVLTGIYKDTDKYDQAAMQEEVNDFYIAAENNTDEWFEVEGTVLHGYSNQSFPKVETENDYLTATYYDDYAFRDNINIAEGNFIYDNTQLIVDGEFEAQEAEEFEHVKGLVTGTRVKNLETNAWYYTLNYYDDRYRLIQSISRNHKEGIDKVTNVYDFPGRVTRSKTSHTVGSAPELKVTRKFEYDHAGRLLKTWHRTGTEDYVLLAANEYNELGQLVTKKVHSDDDGSSFKQHEDYRYNIRGWLTRINNADLNTNDGGPKDFFGMEFGYDNDLGIGTITPQYNGNISSTKWSANLGLALPYLNEPIERSYKFTYDPMNRLREANYATKIGSWAVSMAFKEAMDYDLNGNILSLIRNNQRGAPMDWLTYNYGASNQLKSVTDQGIVAKGFRDRNTTGDDYTYDSNGNMIQDKNKGLGSIKYNSYLNLKEQIDKSTGEKIKYIYNADGVKLAEEIYPAGSQTPSKRTDYAGPFIYENDTLKFIQHEEGKIIIPKPGASDPFQEYQYQIKDHLENVRLTFTTKQKTDEFKATMEDTGIADYSNPRVEEMAYFGNLFETEIRNVNQWLNHTSNTIGNAVYLDASEEKTIGPYTMLKVYPGDTVKMEAFGKYENESSYSTMPLVAFLTALINPVQAAAVSVDGGSGLVTSSLMDGLIPLLTNKGSSSTTPAVYLNYILFDKDFKVADLGFNRIDGSCGFDPLQEATVSFDKMELTRVIDRVGYLYIYVSNESPGTRVWLDDLAITYSHSPIVQFEDYYPFGLSMSETAFERGNDKYKGMVTTDGTGLKDLGFRQYDAAIGRFDAVDQLAELQTDLSTYQYAGNNPVSQVDVLGLEQDDHDKDKRKQRKEQRMVNGKKVKVHNGFVNKQQRRSERTANQRDRQQARTDRREQRQQKREERAKSRESNKDEAHASNDGSGQGSESGNSGEATIFIDMVNGPPHPGEGESILPKNPVVNSLSNGSPDRVFNNYSDNVVRPEMNYTSSTLPISVIRSYEFARKNPDLERTRQYLYSNHPINEARALYQRMLVSRTDNNYLTASLKQNIAVLANTTTSDDVFAPAKDEIKCPTCPSGWKDLIEFKPPQSIYDKFAEENKSLLGGPASPPPTWYVHEMEDAAGGEINLDKYSVTITELPTVNGDQMTIEELFNHIRINLDDFKNDELTTFGDYPDTEFAESERWETGDYVGVVKVFTAYLHVGVTVFDDLAVVASEQTETSWTFSTIHSPATNNHAVSGNRQFGFIDNGDGTYAIFTRGADIATGILDVLAGDAVFEGGEAIWNSFLDNIIQFVQQNSGSAGNKQTTSNRYDID